MFDLLLVGLVAVSFSLALGYADLCGLHGHGPGVMTVVGWLQIATFMAVIGFLTRPLGAYLARVYSGKRTLLQPVISPIERILFRFADVKAASEQNWLQYATSFLIFHAFLIIAL
jgi:K+-transporting ATPase ATPase A chain